MEDEIRGLLSKYERQKKQYRDAMNSSKDEAIRAKLYWQISKCDEIISDLKELLANEDRCGV